MANWVRFGPIWRSTPIFRGKYEVYTVLAEKQASARPGFFQGIVLSKSQQLTSGTHEPRIELGSQDPANLDIFDFTFSSVEYKKDEA